MANTTSADLEILIQQGEGATLEFKERLPSSFARALGAIFGEMSRQKIQESLGLKHMRHFRDACLKPTLQAGLIGITVPDKPQSSQQRYRLTLAGRRYLRRTRTQATTKVRP